MALRAAAAGSNSTLELKAKEHLDAAEEYFRLRAEERQTKKRLEALKDQLLAAMAGVPSAYAGARYLSASTFEAMPPRPDRLITKEMVGQTIEGDSGKKGYVILRCS